MVQPTRDFSERSLMILVYFQKPGSLCSVNNASVKRHPNAVAGSVAWPVSEQEKAGGVEEEERTLDLYVQPEFKLPKPDKESTEWTWDKGVALHPFWAIKRQSSVEEEWNAELIWRDVTVLVAGEQKESGEAPTDNVQCDRVLDVHDKYQGD